MWRGKAWLSREVGAMRESSARMDMMPYLGDRREIADASELIAQFGELAGSEAAARADHSRDLGNPRSFLPLAPDRAADRADVGRPRGEDRALSRAEEAGRSSLEPGWSNDRHLR